MSTCTEAMFTSKRDCHDGKPIRHRLARPHSNRYHGCVGVGALQSGRQRGRQTDAALAFLRTLADYNRTIAQYALAVLPPGVPSEKLLAALVVVQ